ncbi:MAG: biotin--[acetyl-CoA-carboxylase] ligase [Candidatus Limivicinus sp.]
MLKDQVLDCLWQARDEYISGAELAGRLGVSRTAVWKAMGQLRSQGYLIESVTNKGYRLSPRSDVLSVAGVKKYLKDQSLSLQVVDRVDSTNNAIKRMAAEGAPQGRVLIANEQSAGRGRMGRSFFSPPGTGIYMSLLLRPHTDAQRATLVTASAAVAVAEAIEQLAGEPAQIKWVNDVLFHGRKVCGILTEAAMDFETGMIDYVVPGIGVNTALPAEGFPPELQGIAGAAFGAQQVPELRCRLAAAILDRFMGYYACLGSRACYEAYKSRSVVLGKDVQLISPGREAVSARVLDIDEDFALVVRTGDGQIQRVNAGEISLRPAKT